MRTNVKYRCVKLWTGLSDEFGVEMFSFNKTLKGKISNNNDKTDENVI